MTDPEPRPSMGPLLAIGLVLATRLGLYLLFVLLVGIRAGADGSVELAAEALTSDPYTLAALQLVVFGGVLLVGLLLTAHDLRVRDALSLRRPKAAHVLAGVVAGVALALLLAEVDNVLREIRPMTEAELEGRARLLGDTSLVHRVGLALAVSIVAPLTEEALFRGLVLRGLGARVGVAGALALTSVLFGAAHVDPAGGDWPTLVVTALAGLYLGVIALGAGSITPAIVIHAAHNSVALLHPSAARIEGLNVLGEEVYHLPPTVVVASAAALALAAVFFRSPSKPS